MTEEAVIEDIFAGADTQEDYTPATAEERGDVIDAVEESAGTQDEQPVEVKATTKETADGSTTDEQTEEEQVAEELGAVDETSDDTAEEAEASDGTEENQEASDPAPSIPKSRLDAEVAKRKALEARLAEVDRAKKVQADAQANQYDFGAKEAEYMDAVLDGDKEKAMALRGEIRAAEATQYQREAQQTQEATINQTREQLEFDVVVQESMDKYPMLNTEAEEADSNLLSHTNAIFSGYVQQGYLRADAMRMAVDTSIKAFHPELMNPPSLGESEGTSPAAPVPGTTQTEVKKKVETAAKQPPTPVGESNANNAADAFPDISRMSDDELMNFANKNPDTFAKMRGDYI